MQRSVVTQVQLDPEDMVQIDWVNHSPTHIGATMNVVRFGTKTKIAHAVHIARSQGQA